MAEQVLDRGALEARGEQVVREIEERLVRLKRSRIRVAPSAPNTRASSIGHPCARFLYYERTENERRLPHDERVQDIFDLGNEMERYVLRELEDAGVAVVQRGRDFRDAALEISGHVDARLGIPGLGEVQAEIKSMAPWTWEQVETAGDLLGSKKPWLRRYPAQLQTYLYLSSEPLGIFGLVNKSTGAKKWIPMPIDLEYVEGLLRKAELVRDAVRAGQPPERISDRETCAACPFAHVCGPDLLAGPGVTFLPDAVEDLLEAREALEPAHHEWDEVERMLKVALPTAGEYVAGAWVISVTPAERKAYQVAAGSYLRRSYKRLPALGRAP